jgi:acetyl esterase
MPTTQSFTELVTPAALAETQTFNTHLERLLATQPSVHTLPPALVRQARKEGRGAFPPPVYLPQAKDLVIPGRGGDIRLRVLAPTGGRAATGVYLHIHGGGWVLGEADAQDPGLWEIVEATGLCAVSVNYRLAPEHPYPAGPDDCEDAARWLLERGIGELGVPNVLTIGGESAGAHLAAVTLLRLRDRHGITGAFRAANLVFGAFDMSMTPSQRQWGERNLILSDAILHFFGDCFLPGLDAEARRAPDISPLHARLHGMPSALFTVGTQDPLLDDSLFMAARWRAAGAPAELRVWPEAIHGFTMFPLAMSRAANAAQAAFLSAAVATANT